MIAVDGVRQTPVEAKLVKDGKAIAIKDLEIVVNPDKVVMKMKKPVRSGSGMYQIKLSNSQGESSKDIMINIQGIPTCCVTNDQFANIVTNFHFVFFFSQKDVPSPPEELSVTDITQASCILKWKKPRDDGGMPITKYIIERQDLALKSIHLLTISVAIGNQNQSMGFLQFKKKHTHFLFQADGIKLENLQLTSHSPSNVKN